MPIIRYFAISAIAITLTNYPQSSWAADDIDPTLLWNLRVLESEYTQRAENNTRDHLYWRQKTWLAAAGIEELFLPLAPLIDLGENAAIYVISRLEDEAQSRSAIAFGASLAELAKKSNEKLESLEQNYTTPELIVKLNQNTNSFNEFLDLEDSDEYQIDGDHPSPLIRGQRLAIFVKQIEEARKIGFKRFSDEISSINESLGVSSIDVQFAANKQQFDYLTEQLVFLEEELMDTQDNYLEELDQTLDIVAEVSDAADQNAAGIQKLSEIVYDESSLKAKKALISSGLLKVSDAEKELKALNTKIRMKKIAGYAEVVSEQLGATAAIMDNLDIGSEDTRKAIKVISGLSGAAAGFLTNPLTGALPALAAVSGLFRKPKPDVGSLRHKQVMSTLREISNQISGVSYLVQRVDERIRDVEMRQVKILEGQAKLSKQVYNLHTSLQNFEDRLNHRLNFLEYSIASNFEAISYLTWADLDKCRKAAERSKKNVIVYADGAEVFGELDALLGFFAELNDNNYVHQCVHGEIGIRTTWYRPWDAGKPLTLARISSTYNPDLHTAYVSTVERIKGFERQRNILEKDLIPIYASDVGRRFTTRFSLLTAALESRRSLYAALEELGKRVSSTCSTPSDNALVSDLSPRVRSFICRTSMNAPYARSNVPTTESMTSALLNELDITSLRRLIRDTELYMPYLIFGKMLYDDDQLRESVTKLRHVETIRETFRDILSSIDVALAQLEFRHGGMTAVALFEKFGGFESLSSKEGALVVVDDQQSRILSTSATLRANWLHELVKQYLASGSEVFAKLGYSLDDDLDRIRDCHIDLGDFREDVTSTMIGPVCFNGPLSLPYYLSYQGSTNRGFEAMLGREVAGALFQQNESEGCASKWCLRVSIGGSEYRIPLPEPLMFQRGLFHLDRGSKYLKEKRASFERRASIFEEMVKNGVIDELSNIAIIFRSERFFDRLSASN